MDKAQMQQHALRQLQLEKLTARNLEITRELDSLRSNNPNRRKYTLMVGLATIFAYFLVIILTVSLIVTGSLYHMFTFFLGWTVFFAVALVFLLISVVRLRKLDKQLDRQAKVYLEEMQANHAQIAALQNM